MAWVESKGTTGFTVTEMVSEGIAKDKKSARQKVKRFQPLIQPLGKHSPQRYYASSLIEDVKALHYSQTVPVDTSRDHQSREWYQQNQPYEHRAG